MTAAHQRFGRVAIAFHWTIAGALLAVVILALAVDEMGRGEARDFVLAAHKSLGITIFMLTAFRLAWRLGHPAPPLPPDMTRWQRIAAWATHAFLYLATFLMPITGYVSVAARGRETSFFGLFPVPTWVPLDRSLSLSAEQAHDTGQYLLYALIAAHVGAALYHRLILKDQVLNRMWPSPVRQ
jgi:cytochrome b561